MLTLIIDDLGDLAVFRCGGRIVADTAALLRDAVLAQPHMRVAVLDFADVVAVDAAGLGTLVALRGWAEARGAKIKLSNLRPQVEEVLELTGLKPVFEICTVSDMMDLWCRSLQRGSFFPGFPPAMGQHRYPPSLTR